MATTTGTRERSNGEVNPRRPQDIDVHVGARIRERRVMLGLTQQQLAEQIGANYQQIHRFEKGLNRVAAGQMYQIAEALGVEIGYFFDGLDGNRAVSAAPRRLLLELTRSFTAIPDERHRIVLCDLTRALTSAKPSDGSAN